MRGKVLQSKKNHATGGITPAYAGKSCNRFRTSGSGGDHPRLCGEKPASSSLVMFQPGSPPPMRGKALQFFEKQQDRRITPAYAGKSHTVFPFAHVKEDHPRLCGEKALAILLAIGKLGSPPPMRGKAARFLQFLPPAGITPAYAGKSGVLSGVLYAFEDHPRLCGEKKCPLVRAYSILGSPPPMRGKDLYHVRQRLSAKDHPRLCGEK